MFSIMKKKGKLSDDIRLYMPLSNQIADNTPTRKLSETTSSLQRIFHPIWDYPGATTGDHFTKEYNAQTKWKFDYILLK